jgi:hypothetical protein
MSLATFRKAIRLDSFITIGGGEPTLHRKFDTMLLESLASMHGYHGGEGTVCVITNGSITQRAMVLAQLGKAGVVDSQLSRDKYHDNIDQRVVDAFESFKPRRFNPMPGVRNTTQDNGPQLHGRALELSGLNLEDIERDGSDCMCSSHIVKPNGSIVQCGCDGSPIIGNVDDGVSIPMEAYHECCHSQEFIQACLADPRYEHLLDGQSFKFTP